MERIAYPSGVDSSSQKFNNQEGKDYYRNVFNLTWEKTEQAYIENGVSWRYFMEHCVSCIQHTRILYTIVLQSRWHSCIT